MLQLNETRENMCHYVAIVRFELLTFVWCILVSQFAYVSMLLSRLYMWVLTALVCFTEEMQLSRVKNHQEMPT